MNPSSKRYDRDRLISYVCKSIHAFVALSNTSHYRGDGSIPKRGVNTVGYKP